jgi:hypothetical protein
MGQFTQAGGERKNLIGNRGGKMRILRASDEKIDNSRVGGGSQ